MKLTKIDVSTAKPKDKDYKLFDGDGLYLLVTKTGNKHWRLKYRFEGKEKKLSFGSYPEITLKEAREKRVEARKLLSTKQDPNEVKKEEKKQAAIANANTFEALAKKWHETNLGKWTQEHADKIWRRLELHNFLILVPDL